MLKVLITAAGMGKRSGLNGHMRKELLPVYDCRDGELVLRPLVEVIINRYRSYGFDDFVAVINSQDKRTAMYLRDYCPEVELCYQEKPLGFGDAVNCASDHIDGKFILNSGDGLILPRNDTDRFIEMVRSGKQSNVLGLMKVEDPRRYGIASVERTGDDIEVTGLIEKPENPPGNLALVATYMLNDSIFEELDKFSGTNIELTPAINALIAKGQRTTAIEVERTSWLSVGRVGDYISVLKKTLDYSARC